MPTTRKRSIEDIRNTLPRWKDKQSKATSFFYPQFIRPLSYYFTWLFCRTNVSPNTITILSLIVGLAAVGLIGTGLYLWVIIGAVLLNGQLLLDCVDGDLARVTRRESNLGYYLDAIFGYTVLLFVLIAVPVGLYLYPQLGLPGEAFLLIGLLHISLKALRILSGLEISEAFSVRPRGIFKPREKSLQSLVYRVGTTLSTDWRTFLLFFAIANMMGVYLILYTAIYTLELAAVWIGAFSNSPKGENIEHIME